MERSHILGLEEFCPIPVYQGEVNSFCQAVEIYQDLVIDWLTGKNDQNDSQSSGFRDCFTVYFY